MIYNIHNIIYILTNNNIILCENNNIILTDKGIIATYINEINPIIITDIIMNDNFSNLDTFTLLDI